ncbi:MAG: CusA/CzcA family heavy metal efflux RND transporter [Bacteroidia bacterium]|jgi:cobalt-zinc-cadmium resistance protein CzcA
MLKTIINFSVRNKLLIGLFVIGLIGYGSYQITQLPIDAVPDITSNQVQIITVAPSFGATDIERLVTFPVEQANSNIPGTEEIRSFSRFGLSLVTITFKDEIDIYWARQQVSERLAKIQSEIPPEIGIPEMGPVSTGLGEIYQYVVKAKPGYEHRYSETDLRTFQDWIIRRQLLGVDGVAEVSSFGGKLKQVEISVNPQKLQSYQLSITDILHALEENNQNTGGAYIEKGPTLQFIRTEGLIGTMEDLAQIAIRTADDGIPVMLRDVADIRIGHATRYGAMCYNDEGEVTGAVVMMLKGANSNKVIRNVKERIEKIRKSLPEGVEIEPFLDRTKMVNHAISTVKTNLMEGALIVVFILVLFLGNLRAGLLVASVIPLSMLFAVIMMNLFGVSGNLMSLGALDFGLIVDGAVIIIEATLHQLRHRSSAFNQYTFSKEAMNEEVKDTAGKMMNSAIFGQIIILIVYLPILTLQGIEGKMFKPMAQTVAFALTGAFLLSLTYVPMMSAWLLNRNYRKKPGITEHYFTQLSAGFTHSLQKVLQYPKLILGSALTLFTGAVLVLSQMGGEFIPQLEEGDFAVETRIMTGSNLNTMVDMVSKASRILKKEYPEVEKVVTKIGSGEVPTDPMPIEAADMMIILKDKKEWTSAKTFPEMADKMAASLSAIPGLQVGFQYPVQMRFNELMTGARQDVVCKIFGENLDTLSAYAHALGKIIQTIDGARDLYIEAALGMPQVVIEFNRAALAQYRVNIADVNKVINASFAGQSSGIVLEGEKRFDLVVRLNQELRNDAGSINNLLIPVPGGGQIPLHLLAKINYTHGPNQIQREDAKRRIVVGFNVRNRDVQSIVQELNQKSENQIKFPPGYYITFGGAFENLNAAKQRLFIAVPIVLLLIFLLLYFAFQSVSLSLLIYSAIPLSATGGIYLLALRGMPFSISAGIGFIALFGVSVLNGIVLVAEFKRMVVTDNENLIQSVIKATTLRLRPVLMTAAVASFGFFPMALSNGAGAEVQRPLATVVIGGLLLSTFLTLYVLPMLYILFNRKKFSALSAIPKVWLLMLLFPFASQAQTSLTLNQAIQTALKNNLELQGSVLNTAYQKSLLGTSFDPPKTLFSAEYGQINSAYKDNRFSVIQSFALPGIYAAQKQVMRADWKGMNYQQMLKEKELTRKVRSTYLTMLYLHEKKSAYQTLDSLFNYASKLSDMRVAKGESNRIESISASIQSSQSALLSNRAELDYANTYMQLQLLLNTNDSFTLSDPLKKLQDSLPLQNFNLKEHPYLRSLESELQATEATLRLNRRKFLPELTVGYNNMTMVGNGADGITYSTSTRFQSAQVGLAIPVFYGSQKHHIQAASIQTSIQKNKLQLSMQAWETEYKQALKTYRESSEILNRYERLKSQMQELIQAANAQMRSGEINYLNWLMLINQASAVNLQYFDALQNYNQNLIHLHYLMNL